MTNPLTPALTSASTAGTSSTPTAPSSTLGKDDFLKLLVGQMKYQDPMAPSDSQQWMGQMAQFTEVEQVTNIASTNDQIVSSLNRSSTLSLIGRTVTYTGSCYLTYVALDQQTRRPTPIAPVIPRTKEQKRRFGEALGRRKRRESDAHAR